MYIYISHILRKNPDEKNIPRLAELFYSHLSLFKASTIFGPSPRIHLLRDCSEAVRLCVPFFVRITRLTQSSSMHVLLTSGLSLEFLRSWMQWSSRWNLGRVLQYLSRKFNDLPARDMYIERNIDPTISLWSCSSSVKNISACASMPTHESAAQRQVHISFRATCMPGFALTGGFCEVSCASQLSTTYVSNPLHFSSVWWALTGWGSNHVTWQTSSASKMHGTATSQCWPQESTVPSPKLSTRIRASHAHIPSERHEEDRPPASWR